MPTSPAPRRTTAATSRRSRSRDIRVLTGALLALLLVVVWGLVGVLLHSQYADADRASARRAQALSGTLAHHAGIRLARLEELGDLILAAMAATDAPGADLASIVADLDLPPEVRQVALVDRTNGLISRTGDARAPAGLTVESRGRPATADGRRVIIMGDVRK